MKILVLSTKPPWPPHDGGAFATLKCIEGLTANGATVSLLAMKTHKHSSAGSQGDVPGGIVHAAFTDVDTTINPLDAVMNLLFSGEPYDMLRFISESYRSALRSLLQRDNFDVIQCEGPLFSYYYGLIRSLSGARIVLRAHNLEHRIKEMRAYSEKNPLAKAYLNNLSARIKKREITSGQLADAIVSISEDDMKWFTGVCPGKPAIVAETGVSICRDVIAGQREMAVGFIGALDWKPNIDGLLWFIKKVWPAIISEVPAAMLYVAGRNASPNTRSLISGRNIVFEGEVDDSRSFTASMTVMIAPLFAGSGQRIKIIEAMSLERVIIATPVAADGLQVTDSDTILIGRDEKEFVSKTVSALLNPTLREKICSSAADLIRNRYNNLTITARLLDFYKSLCNDH